MEISPLPKNVGERAVNVISVEKKGKGKMKELVLMSKKKARLSEDVNLKRESM